MDQNDQHSQPPQLQTPIDQCHIVGIANNDSEVQRAPNVNVPGNQELLQEIRFLRNTQAAEIARIEARLDEMQSVLLLQPMRIANGAASTADPIIYPHYVESAARGNLPQRISDAIRLSGADAAACSALLGQVPLPGNATELQKREYFLSFLGIVVVGTLVGH
ncbi:hypothetical protein CCMSSC00406_0010179 [Pleurotus cornucopiae]|uniref:Uncharacterized protein n=1 Tax=Pleurotus cornucopiae TaxID=5321 RepID=A0ACB7IHE5_PLECO|nr:hypothetical protein CCMSSC00406_0010179 [Pleurotus cornucopiae]